MISSVELNNKLNKYTMSKKKIISKVKFRLLEKYTVKNLLSSEEIINDCIDETLAAINYTHCCETLKSKEETAFDLWLKNFKHAERDLYWYNEDTLYCIEAMKDIYNTEVKPTL